MPGKYRWVAALAASGATWCGAACGQDAVTLRVISWNLESGDSSAALLRQQIGEKDGVHLWGLSEVDADDVGQFEQGAETGEGADFKTILGTTGGNDRLAIVYDSARFELIGPPQELSAIQLSSGLRAPLVARFRGNATGQEFLFMVNHLKRGGAQNPQRIEQAKRLNQWARQQTAPVIAVGDYNFDYDVDLGDAGVPHRDQGFDELTRDGTFIWVRPLTLLKTQASDDFNGVLDFVFVANAPFGWNGAATILDREGHRAAVQNDFDDTNQQTDHRPVEAVFTLAAGGDPGLTEIEQIRRQIERLEAELRTLKERLDAIDG